MVHFDILPQQIEVTERPRSLNTSKALAMAICLFELARALIHNVTCEFA